MKNNGCDENDNLKSFSLLNKIKEAAINRPFLDIESFLKKYDSWLKFKNELQEKSYDQLVVLYSGAISKKTF